LEDRGEETAGGVGTDGVGTDGDGTDVVGTDGAGKDGATEGATEGATDGVVLDPALLALCCCRIAFTPGSALTILLISLLATALMTSSWFARLFALA